MSRRYSNPVVMKERGYAVGVWNLNYVKREMWRLASQPDRPAWRAKFTRVETVDRWGMPTAWEEQWVVFTATRPTAACRTILESGNLPRDYEKADFA